MKKALITGITGQDGSYLTEFLLEKGYEVHGLIRRSSSFNTGRIDHLYHDLHDRGLPLYLHYGDLNDASSINAVLNEITPHEVYNLAAQSHVRVSFEIPEYTAEIGALGTVRILEAIRKVSPEARFYQASSSELFGNVAEIPQKETTRFCPRSPYACAKAYSYYITMNYRESYGIFACNGILFNHESPRRGETFVTRKITRAAGRIKVGLQPCLYLGNLEAMRDWGFAGDYIEAMWRMLQQPKPDDFVVATGKTYSVRHFVEKAFARLDMPIEWQGEGVHEVGIDTSSGKEVVFIDPKYLRPAEVDFLLGDPTKAQTVLQWEPRTDLDALIRMMVDADFKLAETEKLLAG